MHLELMITSLFWLCPHLTAIKYVFMTTVGISVCIMAKGFSMCVHVYISVWVRFITCIYFHFMFRNIVDILFEWSLRILISKPFFATSCTQFLTFESYLNKNNVIRHVPIWISYYRHAIIFIIINFIIQNIKQRLK